jgi:histidyl-tRNA synthetase
MAVRESVMDTIRQVFRKHGAVTIDTPVFELKEVLTGKYGEDSKLIYDLQDQGGELCALRYDLTVPFARFLAMNKQYRTMKRYHIAKVYRRDQPALTRGRYREFYQCDFDIAGAHMEPMLPDAEVFSVIHNILSALDVGRFVIKCNHRALLDGIFEIAGVPEAKFRPVCSAVDKLDKLPWSAVRTEMCSEKGLEEAVADRIGEFVQLRGGAALIDELLARPEIVSNERASAGLKDLKLLFSFLRLFKIDADVSFDLSLARGLDYYTGVILEAVLIEGKGVEVGSVAGGGRYDNLVGMFSSGTQIPCVGASVGIERLFALVEARARAAGTVRTSTVDVFVAAAGGDLFEERMEMLQMLWDAGIASEMTMKRRVKALDQFGHCEKASIPLAVVLGPAEWERGVVKIRRIADRSECEVSRDEVLGKLRAMLSSTIVDGVQELKL